jgi:hypothetical protein
LVFLYWTVDFACCGDDDLVFIPCIARLRIQNQHCALGYINLFVDITQCTVLVLYTQPSSARYKH